MGETFFSFFLSFVRSHSLRLRWSAKVVNIMMYYKLPNIFVRLLLYQRAAFIFVLISIWQKFEVRNKRNAAECCVKGKKCVWKERGVWWRRMKLPLLLPLSPSPLDGVYDLIHPNTNVQSGLDVCVCVLWMANAKPTNKSSKAKIFSNHLWLWKMGYFRLKRAYTIPSISAAPFSFRQFFFFQCLCPFSLSWASLVGSSFYYSYPFRTFVLFRKNFPLVILFIRQKDIETEAETAR